MIKSLTEKSLTKTVRRYGDFPDPKTDKAAKLFDSVFSQAKASTSLLTASSQW